MSVKKGSGSVFSDEVKAPIRKELRLLEHELDRIFSPDVDLVSAIGKHLVTAKGKMVRPILLFLSAKLGDPDVDSAVRAATAVELIHTATLLHDDSIDRSHLRRGLPTVNRLWNDQVSVIMGDHLFCTAFRLLHEVNLFEVASVLSQGSDRMTYGEMYQMDLRRKYDVTEEAYLRMTRLKTAALFSAACTAGAAVGGLSRRESMALASYGDRLGMAFQMVDDILDFVGDVDLMGKPVGNDLRDGRVTLPLIVAIRNADAEETSRIREIVGAETYDDAAWQEIVEIVERNNGIAYARSSAGKLVQDAKTEIETFKPCSAKAALMRLADLVVSRYS